MIKKFGLQIVLALIALILFLFTYNLKFFKKNSQSLTENIKIKDKIEKIDENVSSVLENISYNKTDKKGNIYELQSEFSEIKKDDIDVNYMKIVSIKITLTDGKIIYISSNDGIYNQKTTDAWLSGNVVIQETDRYIYSDNLDLKFTESFIVAYNNVLYKSADSEAIADKIEIYLDKNLGKTYMYDKNEKVIFNYKN